MYPLIGSPGIPELLVIAGVIVFFFGASKLPDLARGTGQALRIFKEEVREPERATDEPPTTTKPT